MGLRASIVPPAPGRVGFKVDHFELGGGEQHREGSAMGGSPVLGCPYGEYLGITP